MRKQAEPDIVPSFNDGVEKMRQQLVADDALRKVINMGIAAFGVGGAVRGAKGLLNTMERNKKKDRGGALRQYLVEIPAQQKTAGDGVMDSLAKFFLGNNATHPVGMPAFLSGAALALAGGGYGGYKTVDYLMDNNKKKLLDDELAKAKKEYEDALIGSQKSSAANTLPHDLDKLAQFILDNRASIKQAADKKADAIGTLTGLYLLSALAGAGYVGAHSYASARKKSRKAMLEKARKHINRNNVEAPLYAEIEPTSEV